MSRWGKDGVVRTDKSGLTIVDRSALDPLAVG
jgi:hypothetical protein